MGLHESREARLQESDLGPAVDDEPAGHQSLPPPSGDGPGRDVVEPADLGDRQDRLDRLLERLARDAREFLDEQLQVGPHPTAIERAVRGPFTAEAGDPE